MDAQQRPRPASWASTPQPRPLSPLDAMKTFWGKAFTYSGRATRAEYNWALGLFLIYYAIVALSVIGSGLHNSWLGVGVGSGLLLVFIVPWLALVARRCHDLNRPGTFGLLLLATGIGFLVTEGFLIFSDSDPGGVRFDSTSTRSRSRSEARTSRA